MSRSVKFFSNNLVRRAASWMASFLALASVSLSGRSGGVAASIVDSSDNSSRYRGDQATEIQISYVQLGYKDGEDWPPPRPE